MIMIMMMMMMMMIIIIIIRDRFVIQQHNELRDLEAELLCAVCNNAD